MRYKGFQIIKTESLDCCFKYEYVVCTYPECRPIIHYPALSLAKEFIDVMKEKGKEIAMRIVG